MYFDDEVPYNLARALCQLSCQVCITEGQPPAGRCVLGWLRQNMHTLPSAPRAN